MPSNLRSISIYGPSPGWRRPGRHSHVRSNRDESRLPTSSRLDTRPFTRAVPRVGCVIRDRIFEQGRFASAVRAPMMPTASPLLISKDTSLSAQTISSSSGCGKVVRFRSRRKFVNGRGKIQQCRLERIRRVCLTPPRYRFDSWFTGERDFRHRHPTSAKTGSFRMK